MSSVILFFNILLFSIGCIGMASTVFLHTCLKMKLTKYLYILFCVLLVSLGRTLVYVYILNEEIKLLLPEYISMVLGILISISVYGVICLILKELDGYSGIIVPGATVFIISIQVLRTVLFYYGRNNFLTVPYPVFICFVSAYLFLAGTMLYRGAKEDWNPAVKKMIRSMGLMTAIFAPVSAVLYIVLFILNVQSFISLDFVFTGIWGLVVSKVLLHYLSRIGTVPVTGSFDEAFVMKYKISPREKDVLKLILEGYTNKEIGEELFISFTTARTHVSNIFDKTNVKSRIELVSKILSDKI